MNLIEKRILKDTEQFRKLLENSRRKTSKPVAKKKYKSKSKVKNKKHVVVKKSTIKNKTERRN